MPTTFEITARLERVPRDRIGFRDLHRLACYLIEDEGEEAHSRQDKPFTVWPLLSGRDDDEVVVVIHSLVDEMFDSRVHTRLEGSGSKRPNLGVDLGFVDYDLTVTSVTWDALADSPAVEGVDIETLSPFSYSRNGGHVVLPDPILVHRQLAVRWNDFVPWSDEVIDDADSRALNALVVLDHVDIESVRLNEYHHRLAAVGSFGYVLDRGAGAGERELFGRLWSFARFAGLGAMTAHGMGAVKVDPR